MSADRANARKEYRGFSLRLRVNSLSRIARSRRAAEIRSLCRGTNMKLIVANVHGHQEARAPRKWGNFLALDHRA